MLIMITTNRGFTFLREAGAVSIFARAAYPLILNIRNLFSESREATVFLLSIINSQRIKIKGRMSMVEFGVVWFSMIQDREINNLI